MNERAFALMSGAHGTARESTRARISLAPTGWPHRAASEREREREREREKGERAWANANRRGQPIRDDGRAGAGWR
jgi:hypothetical protein